MKNKDIKELIFKDLYRYEGKKKFSIGIIRHKGFKFTFFLRICSYKTGFIYFLSKYFLRYYTIKYGYEISEKTKIGYGFALCHIGGVAINPEAIIGNNVTIYQGVTIGKNLGEKNYGTPKIGNKIWIGPNAVLVGKILIGNNVIIAGNSFVNINIPDNSLVIGNPCKIIPISENKINDYMEYLS